MSSISTLSLPQVLDVKAAGPLASDLLARRGEDLQLDGSQVQRLGAQCLQVLLAARAGWRARGASFELVEPSADLADSLRLLGADDLFCNASDEETLS